MRDRKGRRWFLATAAVFILGAAAWTVRAQSKQIFTGVITDSMCATGDHSHMQMGPNDAECTKACVLEHGATFMLSDGTSAYDLSDQAAAEKFAGQKVRVTGTLDAKSKTIHVESMAAAK